MLLSVLCALTVQIAVQTSPQSSSTPADGGAMLISGGTIITNDDAMPRAEAVLVLRGRIAAVGTLEQVRAQLPAQRVDHVDLKGAYLYPGFADGHAHLVGIGSAMNRVDLMGTTSYRDVLDRVREFAAKRGELAPGTWLRGRGWDQNDWKVKEFPTHERLSKAFPNTPVLLSRVDGHAALANQAAMKVAGLTAASVDPPGGKIIRDDDGNPTGVFIDAAIDLVSAHAPAMSSEELEHSLRLAIGALHKQGITSIHDAGASRRQIAMFQKLSAAGELGLRVHVMVSASLSKELDYWLERGPVMDPRGQVQVRAMKVYADGALGSRGAAMLEEYSDEPGNFGLMLTEYDELLDLSMRGLEAGFQVCTHGIGDRGNRAILDAYQHAFEAAAGMGGASKSASAVGKASRFRIEHAQIVAREDIPRFAAYGVLPAMQTQHQVSDMPWAEDRVGPERIKGAYAWQSMINSGSIVVNGSDAPVEMLDSVGCFVAAVSRTDANGKPKGGWYPKEAMSRADALRSITSWSAYGAFWEDELGSVSVGKRADFTVLSADLLKAPLEEVRKAKVMATVFDGRLVYQAN